MLQRKCCAHCPGTVTREGEPVRDHDCDTPVYAAGKLRLPSCRMPVKPRPNPGPPAPKMLEKGNSCFERFAVAKKFHAENLQHQPLPDWVDDGIFTVDKPAVDPCSCEAVKRCQKLIPRRPQNRKREPRVPKYAPALGCKKPMTYMDLAICWETPIDPSYEPPRAVHIDGSDGGPAPAVFTLVQHTDSLTDVRDGCIPGRVEEILQEEGATERKICDKCVDDATKEADICKHFDSLSLSPTTKAVGAGARNKRAQFMRHCGACQKKGAGKRSPRPRAIRSASCLQKAGCNVIARKNDGLQPAGGRAPAYYGVPRPRTPYARRGFCIDTLAPPFSVVTGCRDADYPENWRLTSIYQQSYRNPRRMREARTLLNYDRAY